MTETKVPRQDYRELMVGGN